MSEWVEIRRGNIDIQKTTLSAVKAGDRYRICTPNFNGPWRVAAENAFQTRGKWCIKDVRPRRHTRGAFQLY